MQTGVEDRAHFIATNQTVTIVVVQLKNEVEPHGRVSCGERFDSREKFLTTDRPTPLSIDHAENFTGVIRVADVKNRLQLGEIDAVILTSELGKALLQIGEEVATLICNGRLHAHEASKAY